MERKAFAYRRALSSLVAVLALVVSACGGATGGGPAKTGADIIIGEALAATGQDAKEGGLTKQGVDLWLDWINNKQGGITVAGVKHKVQVIYKDDQSKPDQSASLDQQLITESKAQFLLGPYGTSATATAAAIAEKNQIPMVEGEGAATSIFSHSYKYVFGTITAATEYLKGVVDMAATVNPKPTKIAILSANDAFSLEVTKSLADYAPTKGFQVVFNQQYPNGSTNLSGLVSQAKATSPDILMNSGHLAEAIAISKAAKQLSLDAKMFAYTVGPSTPDFVTALGADSNYVVSPSQWTPVVKYKPQFFYSNQDYVAQYQKLFNTQEQPDYHVAGGTSAPLALEKAIENANSLDPNKVRDALAKLDMTVFFGEIAFNSAGQNTKKPMVVEQIQGGKHVTVFPADIANAKLQYPTPAWGSR
ncbi:MAG TPA: amino acid ABC transporter substrate-binding protein [Candidatus Dormibacteraeota bacterium]